MDLPDVNVLVSLAWPNHVHHRGALRWIRDGGKNGWATTPFTEAGFVRISSNASVIPGAVTPLEALALLDRLREVVGHAFVRDDVELVVDDRVPRERLSTHRSVTDAHLLAVARRHGARLVTFDGGVASLGGADVELLR